MFLVLVFICGWFVCGFVSVGLLCSAYMVCLVLFAVETLWCVLGVFTVVWFMMVCLF